MAFAEKPPILRGTEQEQLNALRDYLFRMAKSLDEAATAPVDASLTSKVKADGTRVYEKNKDMERTIADVRRNAQELRSLIIKSADDVKAYTENRIEEFNGAYVAQSDFGEYLAQYKTTIEAMANGVVESYNFTEAISSLNTYLTQIDGEIRRGIVYDPTDQQYVTGIAISQRLEFTGQECTTSDANHPAGDDYTYYYIEPNQTFGLYTSTGWQFWIDGVKVGWFSALDGMLHVKSIVVETELQIGASWKLTVGQNGSEFEITYIGA